MSPWSLPCSFGLCTSHGEMHRAGGTGFKGCGGRKEGQSWEWSSRICGKGTEGQLNQAAHSGSLRNRSICASGAARGQAWVEPCWAARRKSHYRVRRPKSCRKRGENAERIKRRNILARGWNQQCRAVRLHTSPIRISPQSHYIKKARDIMHFQSREVREKVYLLQT